MDAKYEDGVTTEYKAKLFDAIETMNDARVAGRRLYELACAWEHLDPDQNYAPATFSPYNPHADELKMSTAILMAAIREVRELTISIEAAEAK